MLTLKGMMVSATIIAAILAARSSKQQDYSTLVFYNTGAGCDTVRIYKMCSLGNIGCTTTIGSSPHVQLYNSVDLLGECSYPLKID